MSVKDILTLLAANIRNGGWLEVVKSGRRFEILAAGPVDIYDNRVMCRGLVTKDDSGVSIAIEPVIDVHLSSKFFKEAAELGKLVFEWELTGSGADYLICLPGQEFIFRFEAV